MYRIKKDKVEELKEGKKTVYLDATSIFGGVEVK